jgi:hypothetical protein
MQQQEDKGAKYIHDGLSLEYRAAHGALGDTLSIAEVASLTPDPENMAKRMIAAWLVYIRRTEPPSVFDESPDPPPSAGMGLKAEINKSQMLWAFMGSPDLSDSVSLYEFAHHAGHGQYLMVQRDDMRAFLEEIGEWPVPAHWSLAGWWPQARDRAGVPAEHQAGGEQLQTAVQSAGEQHAGFAPVLDHFDTTGMVAWQAAVLESWKAITEKLGPVPPARTVLVWLKRNGPRDVFPLDQPHVRDSIQWRDTFGAEHTLSLKNVSDRLSEWRKAGWIPARKKRIP